MSIPEFCEVEVIKAVEVNVDVDELVEVIGQLVEAVTVLTTQVEKSAEAIRETMIEELGK